uniref:Uncharacterized protein n=1 Tax=Oncorhynchus tshawytscha TaxID=74940 RepID=A0AAZ3QK09_ONCTS
MAAAMDVDTPSATNSGASKKRFEVKKWNAVALWAWDIVVDNCAICRNHIMDLCIECQANQASATSEECNTLDHYLGFCKFHAFCCFLLLRMIDSTLSTLQILRTSTPTSHCFRLAGKQFF